MTPSRSSVLRLALDRSGGDVESAALLLERALSPGEVAALLAPRDVDLSTNAPPDPATSEVAAALRDLAARIRREALWGARPDDPAATLRAVRRALDRHRHELARLLTDRQLAESLRAVRAVLDRLPSSTPPPGDVPPWSPGTLHGDDPDAVRLPAIEEAVRDLRSRVALPRDVFDALDAAARRKAFTLADEQSEAVLKKVRDVLADTVEAGASLRDFRSRIADEGLAGTFLSPAHAETVFRTNVQEAFSRGQEAVLAQPLVGDAFPYVRYVAVHDDRARTEHLAMERHGIGGSDVYRMDDPVFRQFRPPWDFNCRCSWIPYTVAQAARRGVAEAKEWLETGTPPASPQYVEPPPFSPPPDFQRGV